MTHPGSKTLLALAIASLLAYGCGGGGGGNPPGDNNPPADTNDPPPGDGDGAPEPTDPDGNEPGEEGDPIEDPVTSMTWVPVNDSSHTPGPNWAISNGVFTQDRHVSSRYEANRAFARSHLRGSYLYLEDEMDREDFDFSTRATLGDEQGLGIKFRYRDYQHFYRVVISPRFGHTRFEKRSGGFFVPIATRALGHQPGDEVEIRAVGRGDVVMVFIDGEPVFSHRDANLTSGTVALYSQGAASFADVALADAPTEPMVVVSNPVSHAGLSHDKRDGRLMARAFTLNAPSGSTVEFALNGGAPHDTRQPNNRTFDALFDPVGTGDHEITATLRGPDDAVLSTHTVSNIGMGLHYLSIGNGIATGSGDNYSADNVTADGRMVASGGHHANTAARLSQTSGVPVVVYNEGLPSLRASEVSNQSFVHSVLGRYVDPLSSGDAWRGSDVDAVIALLGTTEAGESVSKANYKGSLETLAASVTPYRDIHIAYTLPVIPLGADTDAATIDALAINTDFVRPYNEAVDEVAAANGGVHVGPDFYSLFRSYPGLYDRAIINGGMHKHPNSLGHAKIGECWAQYLGGNGTSCTAGFLLQGLTGGLEQNRIAAGNPYYVDADATVTSVPGAIADGIWVKTRNADAASDAANAVSFTVPAAATVYVGYAAGVAGDARPAWLADYSEVGGAVIGTEGGADLQLYSRAAGAGETVTLGGNRAGGVTGGPDNYVVVVVPQ